MVQRTMGTCGSWLLRNRRVMNLIILMRRDGDRGWGMIKDDVLEFPRGPRTEIGLTSNLVVQQCLQ